MQEYALIYVGTVFDTFKVFLLFLSWHLTFWSIPDMSNFKAHMIEKLPLITLFQYKKNELFCAFVPKQLFPWTYGVFY